ncbi:MAG: ACP S-malonyltransferase [Candidatus Eremiobacteraeota bacterium]|nr:ACP S-malonyltransferase [Candidatus Eremiobacteraeota bacterium]
MKNVAFVFPGQGAQKVGMGCDLAQTFKKASEAFKRADAILEYPLSRLCWEGPEDELRKTSNTQPAILTTSIACNQALVQAGITPVAIAGHSVGEYAGLVAAGVLSFDDALRLVRRRGELMQEAGDEAPGTMAAIIGMDYDAIKEACTEAHPTGIVEIANFNTPEQIVISGEVRAVQRAMEIIKEKGARKVAPLNVSGAFHTRLMKTAAEKLAVELEHVHFSRPSVPVVVNTTASALRDALQIKEALKHQILGNVLWVDSVKKMISLGVDTFVEVGPGKALCGMIRKIDKYVHIYNVEDSESLKKTVEAIRSEVYA